VGQRRYEQLADRAWLRRRYVDQRLPVSVIAAELGCAAATARHALAVARIPRRPRGGRRLYPGPTDGAWLTQRYVKEQASTADMAAELGCGEHSVCRALTAAGMLAPAAVRGPELSAASIARDLGCNETTVRNAIRAAAIR
jgi:hypothetical protein